MKVIVYGATGMVGQGVLKECLVHPQVTEILAIGRSPTGVRDPKVRELILKDMTDYSAVEEPLAGFDACFFCLGVSSVGMKEAEYRRVTYDLTMAAARVLVRLNPGMTFCYVTGVGTDSTANGSTMWARVKGQTENELLQLGFKGAYMFRPGFIQPLKGVASKTTFVRVIYAMTAPIFPLLNWLFPRSITTTERIGLAMIHAAERGYDKPVLEPADINALAR